MPDRRLAAVLQSTPSMRTAMLDYCDRVMRAPPEQGRFVIEVLTATAILRDELMGLPPEPYPDVAA